MPCWIAGHFFAELSECSTCGEPYSNDKIELRQSGEVVCHYCAIENGWTRCDWCGCWVEVSDEREHKECVVEQMDLFY